ncbi:MAG: FG-GAP-like repeat-containing protein [Terriglobales bacterium]|jgi:hypothetical protein
MTHKFRRNSFRSLAVPFLAILILSAAFVARAQMTGAGQQSAQHAVLTAQQNANPLSQASQSSQLPVATSGRALLSRPHKNKSGAHPMEWSPLSFYLAGTYAPGGYEPDALAVGDVNGDGKPDLVVGNFCDSACDVSGVVGVLLGNGDGTFQAPVSYSSGGWDINSVAIGDVNGDGKPDIVVANFCQNMNGGWCGWPGSVAVLLGNGDGTFQAPVIYYNPDGDGYFSVAIGDVNGDGKPDLVVANGCFQTCASSVVSVMLGNGDGTFQPPVDHNLDGGYAESVAIADLNGDGRLDLAVADSQGVSVLLGNGDGTFQPPVSYNLCCATSVAIADVNGDGKPDIVVANYGSVGVLLGNGDGTFQSAMLYGSGGYGYAWSVAVGDVNGDGKPDLIVSNEWTSPGDINGAAGVLLGNGDGTFQPVVPFYSGGTSSFAVAVADVNGDGKPDLLIANSFSSTVGALLNNSGATPTTTRLVSSGNPVTLKEVVTYIATVTSQSGGIVTGSVTFQDGGYPIATVALAVNQAAYSTAYTKKGTHSITAAYPGNSENISSTSATLMEQVVKGISTKVKVTTSGSPSKLGQPVTFTATVTPAKGSIPNGELVTFCDGKTLLGTVALASGVAAYTTSTLSAGKHFIEAVYPGDSTFEPSSGKVGQTVKK